MIDLRQAAQQALENLEKLEDLMEKSIAALRTALEQQAEPVLQEIEQYSMQMAGISTAAFGYWKESDGIHPDYDTLALRDVAKLYAKYDALYKAQPVNHGMTKDEALKLALEALTNAIAVRNGEGGTKLVSPLEENAITAIKAALAQPATDMDYTIALQRAIEWHCDGKAVPPDVAALCPYHAEMLNKTLALQETDWKAVAADQTMSIARTNHEH